MGRAHVAGTHQGILDFQFNVGCHGKRGSLAHGAGQRREFIHVPLVGWKSDLLATGGVRAGGGLEVDEEAWRFEGLDPGDAVGPKNLEEAVRARVGLEGRAGDDGPGFGIFEDSERVVGETVVKGSRSFEEWRDAYGAPEEPDDHIDQVGALLEHGATAESGPLRPLGAFEGGVHCGADEEDVAEPPVLSGRDCGLNPGVVAPHVTDLQVASSFSRQVDQGTEGGKGFRRGFFQMDVAVGLESGLGVARVVLRGAFHDHHFAGIQKLLSAQPPGVGGAGGSNRGVIFGKPHEFEVGRLP